MLTEIVPLLKNVCHKVILDDHTGSALKTIYGSGRQGRVLITRKQRSRPAVNLADAPAAHVPSLIRFWFNG